MSERPPIDVLTNANDRENWVLAPLRFILKRRNTHIEERKNEVGSAERMFPSEKCFELEFAITTVNRSRRDDRDEKYRFPNCGLDFGFPQLTRGDRRPILPQAKVGLGATELCGQLPLDSVPERRQRPLEGVVILAGITEKADDLGKVR